MSIVTNGLQQYGVQNDSFLDFLGGVLKTPPRGTMRFRYAVGGRVKSQALFKLKIFDLYLVFTIKLLNHENRSLLCFPPETKTTTNPHQYLQNGCVLLVWNSAHGLNYFKVQLEANPQILKSLSTTYHHPLIVHHPPPTSWIFWYRGLVYKKIGQNFASSHQVQSDVVQLCCIIVCNITELL